MAIESKLSPKKQITNFLFVIAAGVIFGFAIVGFFLYRYNPSGQYVAKNVLISPHTLAHLWYSDQNPKTGGESRFVFDGVIAEQYSESAQRWIERPISLTVYQKFYRFIQDDVSIKDAEAVESFFSSVRPLRVKIMVRTESNAVWQAVQEIFQEIQIVRDTGYYRVQLHEDGPGTHWAYFQHRGIYDLAVQLLQEQI